MANAKLDQNSRPTLTALSNVDGSTIVNVYADPTTHRLLVDIPVSSGTGVPNTTPAALGRIYIKTDTSKVYISTGTSSSADWTLVN